MKYLIVLLVPIILIVSVYSCKTVKAESMLDIHYNILLSKDLVGDYIEKEYSVYNAAHVKRNSRSKNQYSVRFTLDQNAIENLEKSLSRDTKVVKYSKLERKEIQVQNSTNIPKN